MRSVLGSVFAFSLALLAGCSGNGLHGKSDGDSSARNACAANLIKLHNSVALYAGDNDDFLPQADWSVGMAPYLPSTGASLDCPSAVGLGYAMNSALVGQSVHSVGDEDAMPLLFDTPVLATNEVATYPAANAGRHGGNNTVYVSGRVSPEPDLTPADDRSLCLSRLHAQASAAVIYASDHDDALPSVTWMDDLTPYLTFSQASFHCPAVAAGSYGYAFANSLTGATITSIDTPNTVSMIFDSTLLTRNAVGAFAPPSPVRHGGNNVAYADGHATTIQ